MRAGRALAPATAALALMAVGTGPVRAQGLFLAAHGGQFDMSGATRSVRTVADSSRFDVFGGEAGYAFRFGLFASAGGSFSPEKKGERVFVADRTSPVFKLGFPLTLRRNVAYLNVGWRFFQGKRVVPYAAVGGELVSFRESSTVAGEVLAQDQTRTGLRFLAGVEVRAWRSLRVGAEVVGSTVPDTIGVAGVSRIYDEDDIGGITILGRLSYSFSLRRRAAPKP